MAVPINISGLGNPAGGNYPVAGPFISSGGNYYLFAQATGTSNRLDYAKSSSPTTSWTSSAGVSITGTSTDLIQYVSAYQVEDVVHIGVGISQSGGATIGHFYVQFNMATDTYGTVETILATGSDPAGYGPYISLVVRSDGSVICAYQAPKVNVMGSAYPRISLKKRTSGTWDASATVLDNAGSVFYVAPTVVLGGSDRCYIFFEAGSALSGKRELTSANSLSAYSTVSVPVGYAGGQGIVTGTGSSMNALLVGTDPLGGSSTPNGIYFDADVATPTLNGSTPTGEFITGGSNGAVRTFADGTDMYVLYGAASSGNIYLRKSTDNGATWGSATLVRDVVALNGSQLRTGPNSMSTSIEVFTRGTDILLGYTFTDGNWNYYDEYTLRSTASPTSFRSQAIIVG